MNLFATSEDPVQSAIYLDDARVVKQVTETSQLLSTATRLLLGDRMPVYLERSLYVSSHEAHPIARWVRSSYEAFTWTLEHGLALHAEYCRRFPNRTAIHSGVKPMHQVLGISRSEIGPDLFRPTEPFKLCNAAANRSLGLDFTGVEATTSAYRMYLAARWQLARKNQKDIRWTATEVPGWAEVEIVSDKARGACTEV